MAHPPPVPAPGTFANVGRHRLHYHCEGTGTPAVVFDAGIAASSLSWRRVQPEVARFTRACSYDRAGLAWSDLSETPRTIPTLVDELRQVIAHARIASPCVLVGHSFGALVIRALARAYPSEVAGLVFVDPLHPEEWSQLSREQRRKLQGGILFSRIGGALAHTGLVRFLLSRLSGGAPGLPRRVSRMFGPSAATLLTNMVGEVQKLPPDAQAAVRDHWSNPKSFRGMLQHLAALEACSAEMLRGDDSLGGVPLVVLSAQRRDPRWVAADERLARLSRHGRHVVSPQSGHWIHLDDAGLVVDAIRDLVMESRKSLGEKG